MTVRAFILDALKQFRIKYDTKLGDGSVTKLGTATKGGANTPIYWLNGKPEPTGVDLSTLATKTQLTNGSVTKVGATTVGGTSKPIYLLNGTPTPCSTDDFIKIETVTLTTTATSIDVLKPQTFQKEVSIPTGYKCIGHSGYNTSDTNMVITGTSTNVKTGDATKLVPKAIVNNFTSASLSTSGMNVTMRLIWVKA